MLKNIIQHSPTNDIFLVTLHLIHRPKELATVNHILLQKVLLKFYLLKSNFANLNFHGDKVGNSTYIGCLYPAENGRLYSKIGVGLLFYPWNR